VPTEDPSQAWTPQPLPADDDLAREPAPEDVAAEVSPAAASTVADGPVEPSEPVAPLTATPAASLTATPVTPLPDDAELPPSVQLLHTADEPAPEDQRGWAGLLVGVVIGMFFVFVPIQVMVGDVLLWTLVFLVGGALTIVGGVSTGRAVFRRGTARPVPLAGFVLGALILLGCAVATIVGAQAAS